jgi:hypothetical protein
VRGPGRVDKQPIQRLTLHSISPAAAVAKPQQKRVLPVASAVAGGAAAGNSSLSCFFSGPEFAASLHRWCTRRRRAADWTLERWSSTSKSLGALCVCGDAERTHPSPAAADGRMHSRAARSPLL